MIWFVLIGLSVAAGAFGHSWLWLVPAPLACVAVGIWAVIDEPPNYDMHGLGYSVGGAAAVLCLLVGLAARGLAAGPSRAGTRRRPSA